MTPQGAMRRRLPAGVFDSAFASLATFIVGLAAVNLFNDADRGTYAVFFTAFVAGSLLASEFVFTPAEIMAVESDPGERLSLVSSSLRLGLGPCLLGSLASLIAVLITWPTAPRQVVLVLAATSAVATIVSPMQDHVRSMLHIAGASWRAAVTSLVQLVVAGTVVLLGIRADVPVEWLPFGALVLANATSLTIGLIMVRSREIARPVERPSFRAITRRGRWFVVNAAAPAASGFAVAGLITWLAGSEALGYAESARVVAQPVFVLAAGLRAVIHPRSIRAAMDSDRPDALRAHGTFVFVTIIGSVGYLALVGWDWPLNPMSMLVPSAYVVSGLVALTVLANAANAAWFMPASEIAGAGRERSLAGIAWLSSSVTLGVAVTAGFTHAYARPLGSLAYAGARYGLQDRVLRDHYEGAGTRTPSGTARPGVDDPAD